MMMKKFVADTYHEAVLKAQNELGKDMIIITTRVVPKKTWGGLFTHEMIELTAAAPRLSTNQNVDLPSKPMPTEEITSHPQVKRPQFPSSQVSTSASKDHDFSLKTDNTNVPEKSSSSISTLKTDEYFNFEQTNSRLTNASPKSLHRPYQPPYSTPRQTHVIRSIQEGNEDPKSQKYDESEDRKRTEKIGEILKQIIKQKDTITNSSDYTSNSATATDNETYTDSEFIEVIETKINELTEILHNLRQKAQKTLSQNKIDFPPAIAKVRETLQKIDTPPDILDIIIEELQDEIPFEAQNDLQLFRKEAGAWFKRKLRVANENQFLSAHGQKPAILVLIGPTGVGKTTTIAKMAAHFTLSTTNKKTLALFTLDTFRIGATYQLEQFAKIMEAMMETIYEPQQIPDALERHQDKDLIIVDTAGRCQKNKSELNELKEFLEVFPNSHRFLVMSATTKYLDMLDIMKRFREVGFDQLIFTKIDETNSFGPLLAILFKTSFQLAYYTNGQCVPDDFRKGSVDFLINKALP